MVIENTSVPQAEHQAAKPRDPLDVPHISLEEFLVALHPVRLEGLLELRALPSKKQKFVDPHDWRTPRTVRGFSRRRQNLYFGVATRKNDKSGAAENCLRLPALFADIDADDADDLTEGLRRLAEFPLAPSCVVRSGGGLHAYWLLDQPLDVSTPDARTTAKALLRRLAAHLGADLASAEVARVLRLPGSLNYKYDRPRPVTIESLDAGRRYHLAEFEALLPSDDVNTITALPQPRLVRSITDRDRVLRRARKYLAAIPGAIQGNHGDQSTFKAACKLVNDFALTESEALTLLQEWNATCVPPWSERELEEKIANAVKYASGPTGSKLEEHDRTTRSPVIRPHPSAWRPASTSC